MNLEEQSMTISRIINSYCNDRVIMPRDLLLKSFKEEGIHNAPKLLKPLRKKGYIKMSRMGRQEGLYEFQKQDKPIFYREFTRILMEIGNKKRTKAAVPTVPAKNVEYFISTCTIPGIKVSYSIYR